MLALSLGTVKYVDARPQLSPVPFMSVVNRSVTSRAIEVQIVTQAAEGILSRMFCKCSVSKKLNFTKVYVLFHKFFFT